MDVANKVALITGGARIGKTVAEELARRGCRLVLSYRSSRGSAEQTASAAEKLGVRTAVVRADLRQEDAVRQLIQEAEKRLGRLDFVVNMASVYRKVPFANLERTHWDDNVNTDAYSALALARHAAAAMKRVGGGRIVNFADWLPASHRPRYKEYLPYYVSKAAVIGLTEALALELAPDVLVNAIAPGPILKPDDLSAEENQKVIEATPLGRWGGAMEVARAVLLLLETDFITGECIRVDGGRHLY